MMTANERIRNPIIAEISAVLHWLRSKLSKCHSSFWVLNSCYPSEAVHEKCLFAGFKMKNQHKFSIHTQRVGVSVCKCHSGQCMKVTFQCMCPVFICSISHAIAIEAVDELGDHVAISFSSLFAGCHCSAGIAAVAAVNVCRRRNFGRNEAVVAVAPDNNNFIDKDVIVPVLVGS